MYSVMSMIEMIFVHTVTYWTHKSDYQIDGRASGEGLFMLLPSLSLFIFALRHQFHIFPPNSVFSLFHITLHACSNVDVHVRVRIYTHPLPTAQSSLFLSLTFTSTPTPPQTLSHNHNKNTTTYLFLYPPNLFSGYRQSQTL